jgi:DNA repair photolyase
MPAQPALKKIISASRRTDLVAHYPDRLARRIIDLEPQSIHTVVIWTKDARNILDHGMLREALASVGQVFVHWTITGLGGTFLEPSVPPAGQQIELAGRLAAFVGDPRRVHWRYDPLISAERSGASAGNVSIPLFRSLAEPLANAGVPMVHTSFVTLYPKVMRRFAAAEIVPTQPSPEEAAGFLRDLGAAASSAGMRLVTCCESAFGRQRCIDGDLLMELHPAHEPCRTDRARGQRELCGCTVSLDVGRYLPCPSRCLYCYAHPAA